MIYAYIVFPAIWLIYVIVESIAYDARLAGNLIQHYPMGVTYYNATLTICRFINIALLFPLALLLDYESQEPIKTNFLQDLSLLLGMSGAIGIALYSKFRVRSINWLKSLIGKKTRNSNWKYRFVKSNAKRRLRFIKFYWLGFSMFFIVYLPIPMVLFSSSHFPEYRASLVQSIALFSGSYAVINSFVLDPILSRIHRFRSFEGVYNMVLKGRYSAAISIFLFFVFLRVLNND